MKKMKCYDCEEVFQADAKDQILMSLYNHYMKEHKAIITGGSEEEKKAWMENFEKDWVAAEEV